MSSIEIAQYYFDLSNRSDFRAIKKLFMDSTTYSSQNTGLYFGVAEIMKMHQAFHESFSALHWKVNSIKEIKPGIILVDYEFKGEKPDGENVKSSGLEYIVIYIGKIQHIEIRNKAL